MSRLVDLSSEEQHWARKEVPGSRYQRYLHNYLVSRIEELRSRLETAAPEDLVRLQSAICENRTFLGELHAHDPEAIKSLYES
jgi:hypothetical protein